MQTQILHARCGLRYGRPQGRYGIRYRNQDETRRGLKVRYRLDSRDGVVPPLLPVSLPWLDSFFTLYLPLWQIRYLRGKSVCTQVGGMMQRGQARVVLGPGSDGGLDAWGGAGLRVSASPVSARVCCLSVCLSAWLPYLMYQYRAGLPASRDGWMDGWMEVRGLPGMLL